MYDYVSFRKNCSRGVVTHLLTAGYGVRDPSLAEVVTCLPLSIHHFVKAHSITATSNCELEEIGPFLKDTH